MELTAPSLDASACDVLAGHVAIVTGGATGLGRSAAAELARCGADVVIADRSEDALEAAAGAIGPRCTWVRGDVGVPAYCTRIIDAALNRHGHVDTLLDATRRQPGADAARHMTHACVERALRPGGGGMIATLTVASPDGRSPIADGEPAHPTAEAMTRDWAARWAADGISAVAISLGARARIPRPRPRRAAPVRLAGGARRLPARARAERRHDHV